MDLGDVEEVKSLVEAGTPTASTAAAIAALLGLDDRTTPPPPDKVAKSRTIGPGPKSAATQNSKSTAARLKNSSAVGAREDTSKVLSGRDKYALATHAVNHGLKLLSSSLKTSQNLRNGVSPPNPDGSPRKSDALLPRPLQPRSSNVSPVRSSPKKDSADSKAPVPPCLEDTPQHASNSVRMVAQCTQQGFRFLLKAEFRTLGVREMPQWQLEMGLLAFVGSLTSHGLEDLAVRHLQTVKQRLEIAPAPSQKPRQSAATSQKSQKRHRLPAYSIWTARPKTMWRD